MNDHSSITPAEPASSITSEVDQVAVTFTNPDSFTTIRPITNLSLDEYQERAQGTAVYPGRGSPVGLMYVTLKLAGEAGEVAEKVGKAIRDGGMLGSVAPTADGCFTAVAEPLSDERRAALKKELGDVLWYVAGAARELGYSLSEVAQDNLDKLAGRAARGTLQGSGDDR